MRAAKLPLRTSVSTRRSSRLSIKSCVCTEIGTATSFFTAFFLDAVGEESVATSCLKVSWFFLPLVPEEAFLFIGDLIQTKDDIGTLNVDIKKAGRREVLAEIEHKFQKKN